VREWLKYPCRLDGDGLMYGPWSGWTKKYRNEGRGTKPDTQVPTTQHRKTEKGRLYGFASDDQSSQSE
jgi:hypothetical protein